MSDEKRPKPDETVQLSIEETEAIAMGLAKEIMTLTLSYCQEVGLILEDANTLQLIRVTLDSLLKSLPSHLEVISIVKANEFKQ